MKRLVIAATLLLSAPVFAADVGVSVSVNQPGLYGRVDIGSFPAPQLLYPQPVIIQPAPVAVMQQPLYLHVPPGHARKWKNYCGRYDACGRPVFFVQDRWYNDVYVPGYRERHGHHDRDDRDEGRGGYGYEGHGHEGRGDHGNGHGHGHGRD